MIDLAVAGFDAERIAALASRVVTSADSTVTTYAPATGERLVELPRSNEHDVAVAVERARAAQESWARVPVAQRAEVLLRLHDLVLDRQHEILDVIQAESGKARRHAFEEIADVAMNARYYGYAGPEQLLPTHHAGLLPFVTQPVELHHPKGVVGVISPWNYPFTMALSDALPALLAGNAIVAKPASQTALSALLGVDLLVEAGLPEGVWQPVLGDGETVGGAIVDGVDFVCFTGSTSVGRRIAARCGERLIGCTLELGGKNPLLVLDDADLDRAVDGTVGACFSNAGQLCISTERIYVDDSVFDSFRRRFLERVAAMRVELTNDFDAEMGSLISEQQLTTVTEHVQDAVAKGAQVSIGGQHLPELGPYVYAPTVLEGVTPDMRCYATETFGPVVSLYRVSGVDDAVTRANDSPYGLSASVWGRDTERARAVAARLRAGSVNINDGYSAAWGSTDAPMGGMGDSGLGRRHGVEGIRKYTESQTIAVQRVHPVAAPSGVGFDAFSKVMTATLRALRKVARR